MISVGNPYLEPTWDNQLYLARKLLIEKGWTALYDPHALTGRKCGCGTCFCCAARKVCDDDLRDRMLISERTR